MSKIETNSKGIGLILGCDPEFFITQGKSRPKVIGSHNVVPKRILLPSDSRCKHKPVDERDVCKTET
jgi:hypothetical protein